MSSRLQRISEAARKWAAGVPHVEILHVQVHPLELLDALPVLLMKIGENGSRSNVVAGQNHQGGAEEGWRIVLAIVMLTEHSRHNSVQRRSAKEPPQALVKAAHRSRSPAFFFFRTSCHTSTEPRTASCFALSSAWRSAFF